MSEGDSIRSTIVARLIAARKQAGLSQGQVAKLLGFHRPTISQIEGGQRKVSADELSQFADIYNVSISWLAKNEPEMPDPAVELAARELAKLKEEDLNNVLQLLRTLRKAERAKK